MKLIKQTSVLVLAMLMIFATGGIGLYKHYCLCSHSISRSILIEDIDCHEDEINHHCSADELDQSPSSCFDNGSNPSIDDREWEKDHNCCSTEYTFLKIDSFDYVVTTKKPNLFLLALVSVQENLHNTDAKLTEEQLEINNSLSPPLFGRELLVSLQQMKISDPLV